MSNLHIRSERFAHQNRAFLAEKADREREPRRRERASAHTHTPENVSARTQKRHQASKKSPTWSGDHLPHRLLTRNEANASQC
jgi:hypothetical protein